MSRTRSHLPLPLLLRKGLHRPHHTWAPEICLDRARSQVPRGGQAPHRLQRCCRAIGLPRVSPPALAHSAAHWALPLAAPSVEGWGRAAGRRSAQGTLVGCLDGGRGSSGAEVRRHVDREATLARVERQQLWERGGRTEDRGERWARQGERAPIARLIGGSRRPELYVSTSFQPRPLRTTALQQFAAPHNPCDYVCQSVY